MTDPSSRNWFVPIIGLLIATFAVCTAELVITGLLPQLAADLEVDIPTAGLLITGYAVGVGVSGPIMALLTATVSRKVLLIGIMAVFFVGSIFCALSTSYWMLLASRLVLASCQGLFFGVAMVVASQLAPPGRQSTAVSLVTTGVNLATIIGVPVGAAIGNAYGWRMPFWIIAVAAVGAGLVLALLLPRMAAPKRATAAEFQLELSAAFRPVVLLCYANIAFTLVCFFAMISYIVPFLTIACGLPLETVPWVLLGIGITGFFGNLAGGRLGDRYPIATVVGSLTINIVLLTILSLFAANSVLAITLMLAIWFVGFAFPAPVQSRILKEVSDAPNFASTLMGSSFQVGIASGAALGGLVIAAGWAYSQLPLLGALFLGLSLIGNLALVLWDRRQSPAIA